MADPPSQQLDERCGGDRHSASDHFADALLAWYAGTARDLPWRATRDPYRVLVSELMLQQTQVVRVLPAYAAFLARFPDVRVLAAASVGEVVTAWRGLGYNRRAVNLHRAAQVVVTEHDGSIPDDLEALLDLPGVGPYSARAVLAFAFEHDVGPVDTNVARVLARAVQGGPLARPAVQGLADEVVPPGRGHDWSQALMDLGARVCTARSPRCGDCPVRRACAWQRRGGDDPAATGALRPRPQAAFAGSDRYHRGRLVDALRLGPVRLDDLAAAARLDPGERLERVVEGVVDDGLAVRDGDRGGRVLRLP